MRSIDQDQIQQFEMENNELLGDMQHRVDAVRKWQQLIGEIEALQSIIGDKANEQLVQIEQIEQNSIDAHHALVSGTEQLRQANKSRVDFRFAITVLLISLALGLLFLDSYS
jgi:hypothetical protein